MGILRRIRTRNLASSAQLQEARRERRKWEWRAERKKQLVNERERIAKAKQTVSGGGRNIRKPVGTAARYISHYGQRLEAAEKARKKAHPGIWSRYQDLPIVKAPEGPPRRVKRRRKRPKPMPFWKVY